MFRIKMCNANYTNTLRVQDRYFRAFLSNRITFYLYRFPQILLRLLVSIRFHRESKRAQSYLSSTGTVLSCSINPRSIPIDSRNPAIVSNVSYEFGNRLNHVARFCNRAFGSKMNLRLLNFHRSNVVVRERENETKRKVYTVATFIATELFIAFPFLFIFMQKMVKRVTTMRGIVTQQNARQQSMTR